MSGNNAGETLAGVSERRLQALISKRGGRGIHAKAELEASFKAVRDAAGLPAAKRTQGPSGTCGAPAKADWDEKAEDDNLPEMEEDDEEYWEADDSDEDGHVPLPPTELELDIDAPAGIDGSEYQGRGSSALSREEKQQKMWEDYYRKQANQRRAELQQILHRSSALCTLANGLLLDQAANDPMLQAISYSLLESGTQPKVHESRGCSTASLEPAVSWFAKAFSVVTPGDPISKATEAPPDGIEGAARRLQDVAEARSGMPEELVALFVATMRAHGLLARSARALDVLPLRPGRSENARRLQVMKPQRHKPDTAKGSAPKGPVQPIGPRNSERKPAKRRKGAQEEPSLPEEEEKPKGQGAKKKRQSKAEKEQLAREQASPAAEAEGTTASGDNSKENIADSAYKRKGDMEFENQLAMALQASASSPVASKSAAGTVKHGDIPGRAMKVRDNAPAKAQANGSSSAQEASPQFKRQKLQSSPDKPAGALWKKGGRKPIGSCCWAEVYCGSTESGSWVHVDPLSGVIDKAYEIEKGFVRDTPLTYVVALSGNTAKDVTQRYVKSMRLLQRLRDEEWWAQTMADLRPKLQQSKQPQRRLGHPSSSKDAKGGGEGQSGVAYMLSKREDAELQQKANAEIQDVPNTIPAFKSHPKYILERHISRYDMLKPGSQKVGFHRGEAFYMREDLAHLHTAEMWERQGRAVKDSDLSQPANEVKRRGAKDEPMDSKTAEEEAEMFGEPDEDDPFGLKKKDKAAPEVTKLYGDWQTEEWIPPKAENGVVPKNERGNVLCPPLAYCLPQSTVHLKGMPRITLTCKALELDYAVAMVGFETRGGMSVPCFDGVVVCEEHADIITDAYHEAERERQEKAAAKAQAAAESHWRNLLRSIFTRLHVQGQYADADAGVTPEIGRIPSSAQRKRVSPQRIESLPDLGTEVENLDSEQEEEERKPQEKMKSGAAAAAAIKAAKEDAAVLKHRRATWKDPVVAAREAALHQPAAASAPESQPSAVKAESGDDLASEHIGTIEAALSGRSGRATRAKANGRQAKVQKGRRGVRQNEEAIEILTGDTEGATEPYQPQRKRTRNGLVVESEEI